MEALSFCDALNEKFCSQKNLAGLDNIILIETKQVVQVQPNNEKRVIGLDHCNIDNSGNEGEIKKACPLVEELDLSSNRLTDWKEVFSISKQLDHLKFFNLSYNSLESFTVPDITADLQDTLLQKLVLNNTQTDFATLMKILHHFPCINELHMCVNGIKGIPDNISHCWQYMRTLHFAKNEIKDWKDIEKIGRAFPCLINLNISGNPITSIPHDMNATQYFPQLQKLNIMDTQISEWESVDRLIKFPALIELRIKSSPVYQKLATEKQNREMIIARLPKLKSLNASQVEDEERENSERMFIRFFMKESTKPERYHELVNVYGELDELANVNMKKQNMCNVLITGDVESSFLLQVDTRSTVKELRKTLAQRLDLKAKQLRLVHFEQEESILSVFGGIPMNEMFRKLSQYYVVEGNSIQVIRLDWTGKDKD